MIDNKIKTLISLAYTKNFTKTAYELSITQPAVSNQIKLLEEEYDIKIFIKNKNELILTPEGEMLIKYAKKLLEIENNLKIDLKDNQKNIIKLNIGICTNLEEKIFPLLFALYNLKYPSYHFCINTYSMLELCKKLKSNEIDIGIIDEKNHDYRFKSYFLDYDYLALIVAPTNILHKKEFITYKDLLNSNLILQDKNYNSRTTFEQYLRSNQQTVNSFNISMEINNIEIIKKMIELDLGVSILYISSCIDEVKENKLKVVFIDKLDIKNEINFIHNREYDYQEVILDLINIYNNIKEKDALCIIK